MVGLGKSTGPVRGVISAAKHRLKEFESNEVRLLLACAASTVDAARATRIRELAARETDWNDLVSRARRQSVLPLLFWQLDACCPDLVPAPTLQLLREYFQQNTARNVLLTGELLSFLNALKAQGIAAMPYKGPSLAVSVYGNLGLRQFADLDILIRKADVAAATEVLLDLGFSAHFKISEDQLERFIRLSYVRLFQRNSGKQIVELHWGIAPHFFGFEPDIDALWADLTTINLSGQPVLSPSPELLLLLLCVHGAKDGWERLEWLCGVAELVRNYPDLDWDVVFSLARSTGSTRMLAVGLHLAECLLETQLPGPVRAEFDRDGAARALALNFAPLLVSSGQPSQTAFGRIRLQLRFQQTLRQKLRFCLRLAFTTTPVDWEIVRLPTSLNFIYPFLRPFRLLKKYSVKAVRQS
jgi:Uncharacterised nucleotidyltransferase